MLHGWTKKKNILCVRCWLCIDGKSLYGQWERLTPSHYCLYPDSTPCGFFYSFYLFFPALLSAVLYRIEKKNKQNPSTYRELIHSLALWGVFVVFWWTGPCSVTHSNDRNLIFRLLRWTYWGRQECVTSKVRGMGLLVMMCLFSLNKQPDKTACRSGVVYRQRVRKGNFRESLAHEKEKKKQEKKAILIKGGREA